MKSALILVLLLIGPLPVSQAAEIAWRGERVNLVYQEKPLPDLLRELFASAGRPAVISERIKATVTGRFNSPADQFFKSLCSVFGLLTYFDGATLYVYSASESTSRILPLRNVSPQQLRDNLREFEALDKRYLLRVNDHERLVQVAGPPRYVEVVSEVVRLLDERAANRQAELEQTQAARPLSSVFKVFALRHAWAQDTAMSVGGRETIVPGVASMLRRLSGNYLTPMQPPQTVLAAHNLPKLRGAGLIHQDGAALRRAPDGAGTGLPLPATSAVPTASGITGAMMAGAALTTGSLANISLPRIEADARTNAVIVHDLPERIDRYDALIAALDVRATLVQIEASIVDVSSDAVSRLGVDWSQARHQMVIGQGNGNDSGNFRAQGATFAARAAGAAYGVAGTPPHLPSSGAVTVIGNLGRFFLAQVNLLAQEGKAHIHARPSVLTVSNTEAVLENTQTFYVRLAGEREVDLFNVTAGTSLRVTPALVEEGGERRIKLAIRIEDGSLTGQTVDQIPIVQRSTVGTQAMINEGQSLLIGGAAYSVDRESQSQVPWLGDVPALGALFRFQSRQVTRVERLFMITPRVIHL